MGQVYKYVRLDRAGVIDVASTSGQLINRFKGLTEPQVSVFVKATFEAVSEIVSTEPGDRFEYRFLFSLVRKLKGRVPIEFRSSEHASYFLPFAFLFAELIVFHECEPYIANRISWDDEGQVELEFEEAWARVRHIEGGNLLAEAAEWSNSCPIEADDLENAHLKRLVSMAKHLQMCAGPQPIMLPTHQVADLLEVSHQFVSTLITRAISIGWIEVVSELYSKEKGVAKTYRFIDKQRKPTRRKVRSKKPPLQVRLKVDTRTTGNPDTHETQGA